MDDLQKPDDKYNKQDSENYMGYDPINKKCAEDANAERETGSRLLTAPWQDSERGMGLTTKRV